MASNNNNSETVNLSKSQIKRKKRNAAKAKREAEAAKAGKSVGGTSTINSNKPASALNPHEKLRIAVQQKGYSSEDIDTALEEMWNLGLQYDELNAVLNFLDLKKAQKEAEMEKDIAAKEATALVEPASVSGIADSNENNLVEEQSAENTSQTEQATVPAPVKEDLTAASASAQDTMSEASNVNSEAPSETQPISLSSKLAVVANFEVLYDAVFALAEWITKAAKPHEFINLCISADDSQHSALYTIIQRSLEVESNDEFNTVLPPLSTILQTISRNNSRDISPSVKDTLTHARETISKTKSTPDSEGVDFQSLSDAILESVVRQVCKSFEDIILRLSEKDQESFTTQDKGEVVKKLELEIDSLLSQQPKQTNNVVELMTTRDFRKQAAEKSGEIAKLFAAEQQSKHSPMSRPSTKTTSIDKLGLLESLFNGSATVQAFQKSKKEFLELESKLNSANASWSLEQNQLSRDLETVKAQFNSIEARKSELQKQIDMLNAEQEQISLREEKIKARIDEIYNSSTSSEIDELKKEYKKRAEMVDLEKNVTDVVNKLGGLDFALGDNSINTNGSIESQVNRTQSLDPIQLQTKLQAFLILSKSYFGVEARCVEFMTKRAVGLRMDAKELQREIAECTALGMATNVSSMSDSLEQINSNIAEDEGIAAALREEAGAARDSLIERVNEYTNTRNMLNSSHRNLLIEIGSIFSKIGISHGNSSIFLRQAPIPTPESVLLQAEYALQQTGQAPISRPPSNIEPTVAKEEVVNGSAPAPMPKLSWAVQSAPKKPQAKSLRDIQLEEMTKKGGNV